MKLTLEIDTDTLSPIALLYLNRMLHSLVAPEPVNQRVATSAHKQVLARLDSAELKRVAGLLFVRACNCDQGYEFTLPALYKETFKKPWEDLHPSDGKALGRHFSALAKAEAQAAQPRFIMVRKTPQNMAVYRVAAV